MNAEIGVELVGRPEAVELVRAWAQGLGSGPSCLAITGDAGIGKTTAWQFAIEAARSHGCLVLTSRPVEAELPLGYSGLADLLTAVVGPVLDRLPAGQRDALRSALGIGATVGPPVESLAVSRAVLRSLQLLADASPLVVAIDDVQWLDKSSARVLAYAARRLDGTRCSMLLGRRDGGQDPLDAEPAFGHGFTHIALGGLSLGAIAHIVRRQVSVNLPRHRVARIHARSAGNPFHAIQLALARDDELPETLAARLDRRLDDAPAAAAPVLEAIAIRGPLPVALLDATGLDAAVEAGLVVEDGSTVRFHHPLLAEAVYRRIPPGRRRALHAQAASDVTSEDAKARHLALAARGPDRRTAELLASVARNERLRGAPEVAAELAGRARQIMPPGEVDAVARIALDQAGYLFLSADEGGAAAVLDEILGWGVRGAVRTAALVRRALTLTDPTAAIAMLETATAEPHDDQVLAARTLAQLAWQRGAWLGDFEAALPEAERAVALADATRDPAVIATALTTHALLLSMTSGIGAESRFRRAVEILQHTPNEPGDHTPHLAFANERGWRGLLVEAEELLAADRQRALDAGDDGVLMRLAIFGADLEMRRGRWDEAERLLDEALVDGRDYWRLSALVRRGILRGRRGDDAAAADADELAGKPGASGDPYFRGAASHVRGLVAVAAGDVATAGPLLAALPEAMAEHAGRSAEVAGLIPSAVAALAASGDLERGRALTRLLERRIAILEPWGRAALDYCLGTLALAKGEHAEASSRLERAANGFSELGMPWDRGLALLALGMAHRRSGQRSKAADVLEQAAAIFSELRAAPSLRVAADELRRARPRRSSDDRLTEAERRVAMLAAEGRTNREIAAVLFTGTTTVEAHLTRIYSKLGLRSRTELARRVSDGSLALDVEPAEGTPSSARPA